MLNALELREGLESLSPALIATLYRRAPLHRPIHDLDQLWSSYENSTFVLSAWQNDRLVGIARGLTDGAFFSFLCDLAVEPDVQRLGVGKFLLGAVQERCSGTDLLLRDSSGSSSYYPKVGFDKVTNAWIARR